MSRIAIFSPKPPSSISGNNTTLRRLARGLRALDHEVTEVALSPPGIGLDIASFSGFDLLHALHAFKTGEAVRFLALRLGIPYVVSITGTDIHDDLRLPGRSETVLSVLKEASAILAPSADCQETVKRFHSISTPWVLVPKGVETPADAEERFFAAADEWIVFLHVSGWRDVKNNLFCLEPLSRLAREALRLRLRFVGPVVDPGYHEQWLEAKERYPFAEDRGAVEPSAMGREYRSSAVVLNTSHSEGGSNAVLEAMAVGRAVLASDVPGNRAFLRFESDDWGSSTGVLYRTSEASREGPLRRAHDAEDFYWKARRLALDPELRTQIGLNARQAVIQSHSPAEEIKKVCEAYRLAGI